jgi:hypothetical protein
MIKAAVAYFTGVYLDLFHQIQLSPASVSVIAIHEYGVEVLGINDTEIGSRFTHTAVLSSK